MQKLEIKHTNWEAEAVVTGALKSDIPVLKTLYQIKGGVPVHYVLETGCLELLEFAKI